MFEQFPGYAGVHSRNEASGAYPNGARVVKIKTEPKDAHPVGSRATVLGSLEVPHLPGVFLYFVEWDAHPGIAVAVGSPKIALADE